MDTPVKLPFASMPGLPVREDPELAELMAAVTRLPRVAADEVIRNLYRAALGYERTGDTAILTCFAQDALVTMRLRRDPDSDRELNAAPDKPASTAYTLDVEELLRERGM
jgi:hypothetical protein